MEELAWLPPGRYPASSRPAYCAHVAPRHTWQANAAGTAGASQPRGGQPTDSWLANACCSRVVKLASSSFGKCMPISLKAWRPSRLWAHGAGCAAALPSDVATRTACQWAAHIARMRRLQSPAEAGGKQAPGGSSVSDLRGGAQSLAVSPPAAPLLPRMPGRPDGSSVPHVAPALNAARSACCLGPFPHTRSQAKLHVQCHL